MQDSLGGYLAKVIIRTGATLLVEGRGDADLVWSVASKCAGYTSPDPVKLVIDTAEMVKDVPGVFSNREKVEHIHSAINTPLRFAAFVDREFRGFHVNGGVVDDFQTHNAANISCFWTRGHSIENYVFLAPYFVRFLEFYLPGQLPNGYQNAINVGLKNLVETAVAMSFAIRNNELIDRTSGIFRAKHWVGVNGVLEIDLTGLEQSLLARHIPQAKVNALLASFPNLLQTVRQAANQSIRWFAHGHVGFEMIWTGIAQVLVDLGMDVAHVQNVENGCAMAKIRLASEDWASACNEGLADAPTALIDWIKERVL